MFRKKVFCSKCKQRIPYNGDWKDRLCISCQEAERKQQFLIEQKEKEQSHQLLKPTTKRYVAPIKKKTYYQNIKSLEKLHKKYLIECEKGEQLSIPELLEFYTLFLSKVKMD